jgi:L-iditol 2-dehydrogenase
MAKTSHQSESYNYATKEMKVAVYYRNDDIRIEERPMPEIEQGEILVRMMASGICGTDVMEWYRRRKAPCILGHEMAGVIEETGGEVQKFRRGDRVFVSHHVPCFHCRYCQKGDFTACETLHRGNYMPGGFSEYIRVPEQNVAHGTFLLPESMGYDEASMIEPLGCVLAGQNLMGLESDQTVLIIGSGVSGLLHIKLSKLTGARVIATDINEERLHRAGEYGADSVINASTYSTEELKRINRGRLADRVIVCAGAEDAAMTALSSVDRKGKVLFFAVPEKDISIPAVRCWRDEVTIAFSYGASPRDLHSAMEIIGNGGINIREMITHRVSLSDIQEGFRLVSEGGESLKVVVIPDEQRET